MSTTANSAMDDCYFYYYSNCTKGAACGFRHEPLARGTEEVCEDWEYGRCLKQHCNKRHMVIKYDRSSVQCYWETQPSGCQKVHCVFKHRLPRPKTDSQMLKRSKYICNDDVPSPKMEPVLIHTGDTDEESPIKQMIERSDVTDSKLARRNLNKYSQNEADTIPSKKSSSQQSEESDKQTLQQIEDDIINLAKKGLKETLMDSLTKTSPVKKKPVQVKSLKEIKREKILKARQEYERKLLALRKEQESVQPPTAPRISNSDKADINVTDVRVKSFNKAQQKQRQRNNDSTKETNGKTAPVLVLRTALEGTSTKLKTDEKSENESSDLSLPVIPVRKMKIKSRKKQNTDEESGKKKPATVLKRPAPPTSDGNEGSKVLKQRMNAPDVISHKTDISDDIHPEENGRTELEVPGKAAVEDKTSGLHEQYPGIQKSATGSILQSPGMKEDQRNTGSTNRNTLEDFEVELDLLDDSSSSKLKTTLSHHIDDDDLLNEMEELLA